jgi:hypothetical protein
VDWYNLVGNQVFRGGLVTRFDLNSPNGPVAGGAFTDPFSPGSVYDIGWTNGDFMTMPTPVIPDPSTTGCTPGLNIDCTSNYYSIPSLLAGGAGFGGVPEPETWALMLIGFVGLGLAGYRRERTSRSIATA